MLIIQRSLYMNTLVLPAHRHVRDSVSIHVTALQHEHANNKRLIESCIGCSLSPS